MLVMDNVLVSSYTLQLLEINAHYTRERKHIMVMKFHFIHFRVANIIIFCGERNLKYFSKKLNLNALMLIFQLV